MERRGNAMGFDADKKDPRRIQKKKDFCSKNLQKYNINLYKTIKWRQNIEAIWVSKEI